MILKGELVFTSSKDIMEELTYNNLYMMYLVSDVNGYKELDYNKSIIDSTYMSSYDKRRFMYTIVNEFKDCFISKGLILYDNTLCIIINDHAIEFSYQDLCIIMNNSIKENMSVKDYIIKNIT